jgi:hypothetical protein
VEQMQQYAPYPQELADLIANFTYKPGWEFRLVDMERDPASSHGSSAGGLTVDIISCTFNSYHPEAGYGYRVHHYRIVPAATYNRRSWRRWLLDELVKIETHEACEFFRDGEERPFAPTHGPGNDPYYLVEYVDDVERRTSFRGTIKNEQ